MSPFDPPAIATITRQLSATWSIETWTIDLKVFVRAITRRNRAPDGCGHRVHRLGTPGAGAVSRGNTRPDRLGNRRERSFTNAASDEPSGMDGGFRRINDTSLPMGVDA